MISTTHTNRIGTITTSGGQVDVLAQSHDDAAEAQIGAVIVIVKTSSTSIWTCWMSLVSSRDQRGAPNRPTSWAAKDYTVTNRLAQVPASAIAVRARSRRP